MIPLRDINPTVRRPIATIGLIVLNVASWVFVERMGNDLALAHSLCALGLIPGELLGLVASGTEVELGHNLVCRLQEHGAYYTLLTHQFLHGGWFHILGNMWFLWLFGDNVEDAMGRGRFVAFYLTCGLAAAIFQIISSPSTVIPMVGASGAIGGVMGGYVRLYPRAYVVTLLPLGFFLTTVAVPAIAMLGYWFIVQLAYGIPALGTTGGGTAFWAHVGGFLTGLLLIKVFHRPEYLRQQRALSARIQVGRHLF